MRLVVFLALIAVPLAEIALLIAVGRSIGVLATVAIVVLTAVVGTIVLRRQGFAILMQANQSLQDGKTPLDSIAQGILVLIAGVFLVAPGLITDTMGLVLLIPPVRAIAAGWLVTWLANSGAVHVSVFGTRTRGATGSEADGQSGDDTGPVIDGEFERLDDTSQRATKPRSDRER
ncbi:MAG: FxsA family protein [Hyphomicrobiaceae bacterium]|nr:FxsA family protein [Hyphomicrobiaceae bacterium]